MLLLLIQIRFIQHLPACWIVDVSQPLPDQGNSGSHMQTAGDWSLYGC